MSWFKTILLTLFLSFVWAATCVYGGVSGWFLKPIAETGNTEQFIANSQVLIANKHVNIAYVLIENGQVVFQDYSKSKDEITANTLFPVASLSKFITAYGVITLAEQQQIRLERAINEQLTGWQLPESEFDNQTVSLAHLLSHTAGLGDGLGFADIELNETVPSLLESLNKPISSTGVREIKVTKPVGDFQYSGGGYLMLELLVEEKTNQRFATWMADNVFKPVNMTDASYDVLTELDNIAPAYDKSGQAAGHFQYASAAATGLLASSHDLIALVQALTSPQTGQLSPQMISTMREPLAISLGAPIWGLGTMLYAPTASGDFVFGHDGANEPAINSTLRINPDNNDAIIVVSSGGEHIASKLGYEWTLWQTGSPDFLAFDVALQSAFVPCLLGLGIILIGMLVVRFKKAK
ncbi:serine hydrolase domain-containing protein [Pseudoalteromonas simplex]|uniref:serine hydrolase domain-containing protein n=1 Tax=Pseudoalteromonas simplex TaxID=2783613 RepID=UPI00188818E0|nr:serine hydrolase domain-containing protein [Pseudoalteromonas sp. A520]